MSRFEDQTAIVTGAAEGLGYGIAERLGSEGARVVIVDMNGETAEQASKSLGERGNRCRGGHRGRWARGYRASCGAHRGRPMGAHRHIGEQRGHRGAIRERVGAVGRGDGPGVPDEPAGGVLVLPSRDSVHVGAGLRGGS